jgi:hypothetical protein
LAESSDRDSQDSIRHEAAIAHGYALSFEKNERAEKAPSARLLASIGFSSHGEEDKNCETVMLSTSHLQRNNNTTRIRRKLK